MAYEELKDVLLKTCSDVYHYTAPMGANAPYIVWAEDGQGESVYADGGLQEMVATGTIDLFTQEENDPLFEQIGEALELAGIACRWNSTQLEADTGLIHYEWVWQIWQN